MRKKSPDTIDELIRAGYRVPCFESISDLKYTHYSKYAGLLASNSSSCDFNSITNENFFKFDLKNALLMPRRKDKRYSHEDQEFLLLRNEKDYYNDPVKFSKDSLESLTSGVIMTKSCFMFKSFRETFRKLFEFGIIDIEQFNYYLCETGSKETVYSEHIKEEKKVVLTWKHLHAGFYVWLCALVFCIIVFICEICMFKCKEMHQSFKVIYLRTKTIKSKLKIEKKK